MRILEWPMGQPRSNRDVKHYVENEFYRESERE